MEKIKWEAFELKHDKAKELKLDQFQEPTTKDYLFMYVSMEYGGICSEEELWKITEIIYEAYKRETEEGYKFLDGKTNKVKIHRLEIDGNRFTGTVHRGGKKK